MYSAYTAGVIDRYHDVDACNSCMGAAKSLLRAALIAHGYILACPRKYIARYTHEVFFEVRLHCGIGINVHVASTIDPSSPTTGSQNLTN